MCQKYGLLTYFLDFADIYHYHENTKQLNNEMKWNKRNQTCHVCHINVWNAAYMKSYPASCFKPVKHAKTLNIKNQKIQELRST